MTSHALPVLSDSLSTEQRRIVASIAEAIEGEVRFGRHDRMLYATDASIYQVEPLGVVIPKTSDDVRRVVEIADREHLALLPRGGGTSLAGQTVNRALVIDFSPHCRRLLDVDVERRQARVEPGIVLDHLNADLTPHGLMFAPDVATSTHATIGGMIGNNSAGAHSVMYGRTVESVDGLDVLLADGTPLTLRAGSHLDDERLAEITAAVVAVVRRLAPEIDRRFPKTRRRVDGYNLDLILEQIRASSTSSAENVNLAHLVCGSEGTLAVTREATLRLVPRPALKGLGIIGFETVDAALATVTSILETGPAAIELIDDVIIDLAEKNIEHRHDVALLPHPGDERPGAVLYVEYFADTEDERAARLADLEVRFGSDRVATHTSPHDQARAWKLRKAGEPLLHGQPGARKPITFVEDTAVDPERLSEFVHRFRAMLEKHRTFASYYAHASVGCLHIRPMISLKDPSDQAALTQIMEEATDLVLEFGGALSGEHGDGRLRSGMLRRFYGDAIVDGFAEIKRIFDPENRMNPGNIVDPPPMLSALRVDPGDASVPQPARVPPVKTYYRYDREHGFDGAVEMCNGAGVCRRMSGGTMCPSYRATRDERHATRGRGNALRLAITGQLARDGAAWDEPETHATLDLCLSCKACKRECPSNVDIAKLKAEYLAQGFAARGGAPLRLRLLGQVRRLLHLASFTPRLSAALARSKPARLMATALFDIDPRRSLPPVSKPLHRDRPPIPDDLDAPVVILLPDCFSVYSETDVGRAAIGVLRAFGYRVVLPRTGCCGRPMISQGLLEDAVACSRKTARDLVAEIRAHDAVAVVGLEPSCISAVIDDWADLELGLDAAALADLRSRSMLIEDFLEAEWSSHPRRPAWTRVASPPVVLHGHCHQKALGELAPTARLLERAVGAPVDVLDTGCCGMAGAFGYTRDHFELSLDVAELSLLPQLRAAPDAIVAAPGTSCRHQVRDALGREALHPIQILADRLDPST